MWPTRAWPLSWYAIMRFVSSFITLLLRSGPAITRSNAAVTSAIVITFLFLRAVKRALSFIKFIKSAPVKPDVRLATRLISTSLPMGLSLACTSKIFLRPSTVGRSTTICLSKRPGRRSAGSKMSARFVAAMSTTLSVLSNPSISTSSWLSVCSRSS